MVCPFIGEERCGSFTPDITLSEELILNIDLMDSTQQCVYEVDATMFTLQSVSGLPAEVSTLFINQD